MRILIAIGVPRAREAGAAGVVLHHSRELRKRGHAVECWFLEDVTPRPVAPKRLEALTFAYRVAKRILKDPNRFDVVNLHAPFGCVYGAWRKALGPGAAPPYVMLMHGSEDLYVHAMGREQKKGRAQNFGWRNRAWHRVYHQNLYDLAIRTADYGLIVNRQALVCTQLKYNRNGDFSFLPNAAEESFFVAREYSDRAPVRLLYVGTWLDRKGVFYLAEAFREIARKLPEVTLTVAGCLMGTDQVKQDLAASVRDRVNVVPFVSREGMPELYAQHDLFVFPSLVEGMPLTLLEAMAAGMPVVTTTAGGMADVVEDDVSGLLVPPANASELARAVERLCQSAGLRRRLGQEAQQKMRRYTWDRVTGQLEHVLVQAVRGVSG